MEIFESSAYVKAKTRLLAEYFSDRGWVITTGTNNSILIYLSFRETTMYNHDKLVALLAESDYYIKHTELKMSAVTYLFFFRGTLVQKISVLPGAEYDLFTEKE